MEILIGLEDVSLEWPGKRVLVDQTATVAAGDRCGIVGRNGDGKSTLLRLIDKTLEPDSGRVTWRNGISVGIAFKHTNQAVVRSLNLKYRSGNWFLGD